MLKKNTRLLLVLVGCDKKNSQLSLEKSLSSRIMFSCLRPRKPSSGFKYLVFSSEIHLQSDVIRMKSTNSVYLWFCCSTSTLPLVDCLRRSLGTRRAECKWREKSSQSDYIEKDRGHLNPGHRMGLHPSSLMMKAAPF